MAKDGKRLFGLTYMWFIVHLRGQGVVKDSLRSISYLLYQRDRGWLEVFGGEGARVVSRKLVRKAQVLSFNRVLVYVSLVFFSMTCFFFLFFVS